MPSSTSRPSRSVSTLRAIPRLRWKSSKRRTRRNASRRTSSVQRSPRTSRARAIEHTWPWYVRGSIGSLLLRGPRHRPGATSASFGGRVHVSGAQCSHSKLHDATESGRVGCMTQPWKVLLVTSVAVFMGFLDVTIVNIAFPDIEASFPGSSLAGLSWILNAYNIVFAALLVPAGRLADRVGRRRMFFVGLLTFLAASLAAGLAPTVE